MIKHTVGCWKIMSHHACTVKRVERLEAKIDRLQAIFREMAVVIRDQELPDGDGLDVTVPMMLWLESVVKSSGVAAPKEARR